MPQTLSIVQINDTHANLLEHEDVRYMAEGFKVEALGGFPRILSKIKEWRAAYPGEVLVLDNGDTLHGTHEAVQSRGEVMIPYLKALGVEAMTFHWDAAYTPQHLLSLQQQLGYPVLACNVYHEGTKRLMFKPAMVLNRSGLKVGIIGAASNIIRSNMPEVFWRGADFTDSIKEAAVQARRLREQGADLVVLLSHLGYPQDIELLGRVQGIDLCLSGHTHNRIRSPQKIGNAYIIQSGAMASSIGFLRLTVENKAVVNVEHEYVTLDKSVPQDRGMLAQLRRDPVLKQYRDYLDEFVGRTRVDLHRASSFYSTMDYLLLDAMCMASGLSIAFSNGWRYGGAVRKGPLKRRHLYAIVPMNPVLCSVELMGKEILDMLEDNLESTFSAQPFKQMGGYIKRNTGLRIYFKLENPYGQRIQKVFAGEEEIDPGKVYKAVYVTRQAVPESYGQNHHDLGVRAVDAMEVLLKIGPYDRKDLDSYIAA